MLIGFLGAPFLGCSGAGGSAGDGVPGNGNPPGAMLADGNGVQPVGSGVEPIATQPQPVNTATQPGGTAATPADTVMQPEAEVPPAADDTPAVAATTFGPASVRLLTVAEYTNTVEALFGEGVADGLDLSPDSHFNGMASIASVEAALTGLAAEKYEVAAYAIADQVLADTAGRDSLVGCDPSQAGCYSQFIEALGRRAWRRPLTDDELQRLSDIAGAANVDLADAWAGVRYALAALLQSPYFLYRTELGVLDPADASRRPLSEYELATRLAYFLHAAPPDDALLDAARDGELSSTLTTEAERLLSLPQAASGVENFFSEYLQLYRLSTTEKSAEFAEYTAELKSSMAQQTLLTMSRGAFASGADFREVFSSKQTYLDDPLAEFYGVELAPGTGFRPYTFTAEDARAGVLTNASILSAHSHNSTSSPTLRGKFIREVLLCQGIPAPPPGVDITLPELSGDIQTARQRLEVHATEPTCAACHALMDPIGLGLENFDTIGRYRSEQNGAVIDPSGQLVDASIDATFSGPEELAQLLAGHPDFAGCFVRTLFRHGAGSLANESEETVLLSLTESFVASNHELSGLLLSIVQDPAFGYVRALDLEEP